MADTLAVVLDLATLFEDYDKGVYAPFNFTVAPAILAEVILSKDLELGMEIEVWVKETAAREDPNSLQYVVDDVYTLFNMALTETISEQLAASGILTGPDMLDDVVDCVINENALYLIYEHN